MPTQVLSEMFVVLQGGKGLRQTLNALIDFASDHPRMETGCHVLQDACGQARELGPRDSGREWRRSTPARTKRLNVAVSAVQS